MILASQFILDFTMFFRLAILVLAQLILVAEVHSTEPKKKGAYDLNINSCLICLGVTVSSGEKPKGPVSCLVEVCGPPPGSGLPNIEIKDPYEYCVCCIEADETN